MTGATDEYGEIHRILLSFIRSLRAVNNIKLEYILKRVLKSLDSESDQNIQELLDQYIVSINTRINNHGYKIDKVRDEITDMMYYVFINTISDEIVKGNTAYSALEIEALKKIIDHIIEDSGNEFSIGLVNAKQIISAVCSRGLREAEILIYKLIDDGWLILTTLDRIILSVRSKSELKRYLLEKYGNKSLDSSAGIYTCYMCTEMCTLGKKCPNPNCATCFHYKCRQLYIRGNGMPECPTCHQYWDLENITTEAVIIGVPISTIKNNLL